GQDAGGRPARREPVRVARLVEGGVDGIPSEPDAGLRVVEERRRAEWELDDVVEQLPARAVAEPHPQLAEPGCGEAIPGREANVLGLEPLEDLRGPGPIAWIALEVRAVLLDEPHGGRAVHVVGRASDGRQAAGDDRLAQALGRDREVGHRREAPEALTEDAPAIDTELPANVLGVTDDRVGAEVRQVSRLF